MNRRWMIPVLLCALCLAIDMSFRYNSGYKIFKIKRQSAFSLSNYDVTARMHSAVDAHASHGVTHVGSTNQKLGVNQSSQPVQTDQVQIVPGPRISTAKPPVTSKNYATTIAASNGSGMDVTSALPTSASDSCLATNYRFLISHTDTCGPGKKTVIDLDNMDRFDYENDMFLLMVIKSMCGSEGRRRAIRETWGNVTWMKEKFGVRVGIIFLLGACQNEDQQKKVKMEDQNTLDILQWDFFDSFRNLTLKDCLYLQWFTRNCRNVPYIFKGDDDVFVNAKNIVKYLTELRPEMRKDLFVGSLLVNSPRVLNSKSKYFVSSDLFPDKFYPPYVSGGGFIMSGDLAVRLFFRSLKTKTIPIDDAYMGILLKSLGISPCNDHGFKNWGLKNVDSCRLAKIKTFHRVLPQQMHNIWKEVNGVDLENCEKETDDVLTRINR